MNNNLKAIALMIILSGYSFAAAMMSPKAYQEAAEKREVVEFPIQKLLPEIQTHVWFEFGKESSSNAKAARLICKDVRDAIDTAPNYPYFGQLRAAKNVYENSATIKPWKKVDEGEHNDLLLEGYVYALICGGNDQQTADLSTRIQYKPFGEDVSLCFKEEQYQNFLVILAKKDREEAFQALTQKNPFGCDHSSIVPWLKKFEDIKPDKKEKYSQILYRDQRSCPLQ